MKELTKSYVEVVSTFLEAIGFKRAALGSYPKTRAASVAFWMGAAVFLGWSAQYVWSNETGPSYFAPTAVAIFATCLVYSVIGGLVPLLQSFCIKREDPLTVVPSGIFNEATWALFCRATPDAPPTFMDGTFQHKWVGEETVDWILMGTPVTTSKRDWLNAGLKLVGLYAPTTTENLAYHRNLCKATALGVHSIFCLGMLVVWIELINTSTTPTSDYARLTRNMSRLLSVTVTWVVVAPTVTGGLLDMIHTFREDRRHPALFSRLWYSTTSLLLRTVVALLTGVVLNPITDLIWNHEQPQTMELQVICGIFGVMLLSLFAFWTQYSVHIDGHHDLMFAWLDWPSTLSLIVYSSWCFVARIRDDQTVSVADQAMTSYFLLQATYAITTTIGCRDIPAGFDHTIDTDPVPIDPALVGAKPIDPNSLPLSEPKEFYATRMAGRFRQGNAWRLGRYARTPTEESGPRSLVAQAM